MLNFNKDLIFFSLYYYGYFLQVMLLIPLKVYFLYYISCFDPLHTHLVKRHSGRINHYYLLSFYLWYSMTCSMKSKTLAL
jgi:hypothetical protein